MYTARRKEVGGDRMFLRRLDLDNPRACELELLSSSAGAVGRVSLWPLILHGLYWSSLSTFDHLLPGTKT